MKTFLILFINCFILPFNGISQSKIEKIDDLKSNSIFVETDYANIRLETWDMNYVEVESDVTINLEKENKHHSLKIDHSGSGVKIRSEIDYTSIEKMVILTLKNGNISYTPLDDWDDTMKGQSFSNMNIGYNIEGEIVVKIPKGMALNAETTYGDILVSGKFQDVDIHSTYGLIEATFDDLTVMKKVSLKSTYDVVDLTLDDKSDASLMLNTTYGSIYTDLPLESTGSNNKHGQGCTSSKEKYILNEGSVSIDIVSTYDNIYVRASDL